MKAILEFNLDEPDDRISHNQCVKANDMAGVLWELVYNTKKKLEWELDANDKLDRYEGLEMVYKRIYELLEEHDVNIDSLYV
jgi:hypothetical protein